MLHELQVTVDIPINGLESHLLQRFVAATKAATAQKGCVCLSSSQGTGMRRADNGMRRRAAVIATVVAVTNQLQSFGGCRYPPQ
jgi:hypothetical protein